MAPEAVAAAKRLVGAWRAEPINSATNEEGYVQRASSTAPVVTTASSTAPVVTTAPSAGVSVITSADVIAAQSLLARLGYNPGPADGHLGPRTRDAILLFEERSGMPASGRVSRQLIDRLRSLTG